MLQNEWFKSISFALIVTIPSFIILILIASWGGENYDLSLYFGIVLIAFIFMVFKLKVFGVIFLIGGLMAKYISCSIALQEGNHRSMSASIYSFLILLSALIIAIIAQIVWSISKKNK